ncbi:MAG: zf-HC2 domain-containing protein [Anaerolineae bacterium]|nr:zf-HC2 domain-containing protein [Anaerolineae bacterium]
MHDLWLSQLPYYAAGTLDPAERAALEAHLSGCEGCRTALESWTVIAGAVREDVAVRVEALPPLNLPDVFSRNGHAQDAPSNLGRPRKPEKMENPDMTVHFSEIVNLRPAPQSRSLLTLVAVVLLIAFAGAGALLLTDRLGDSSAPAAPAPGGERPDGLGAQIGTPTMPPTSTPFPLESPIAEHLSVPQMTVTALIEHYQATQSALPEKLHDPLLAPTVFPPTPTPIMMQPTVAFATPSNAIPLDYGLPARAEIEGVRFEAQTWNNSGPAALSMALSALGWEGDQAEAAAWLRAEGDDKNVMLWEMVAFVEQQTDYGALHRVGGVPALLKRLVAAGFPVVIPVGFEPEAGEWYGHHWVVTGYDDDAQTFLVYDSYLGAGEDGPREIPYSELDDAWRQFSRAFLIVYRPEDRAEALDELAQYADPFAGRGEALRMALNDSTGDPGNAWSRFNLGAAWAGQGYYATAAAAFDEAFALGLPGRTLWYRPEPYVSYYGAGRLPDVLRLADEQSQSGFFEEATYWRGMVFAAQGFTDLARQEFDAALEVNPNYLPAQAALAELTLFELNVPFFPAGRSFTPFDPPQYSSVEPQSVSPTPSMAPPIRATPTPISAN